MISKAGVKSKGLVCAVYANPGFRALSDSLFKKKHFTLETNRLHPFERVPNSVVAVASEAEEKPISIE